MCNFTADSRSHEFTGNDGRVPSPPTKRLTAYAEPRMATSAMKELY